MVINRCECLLFFSCNEKLISGSPGFIWRFYEAIITLHCGKLSVCVCHLIVYHGCLISASFLGSKQEKEEGQRAKGGHQLNRLIL